MRVVRHILVALTLLDRHIETDHEKIDQVVRV